MDDLLLRLRLAVHLIVPLILFMASTYLALHIVFARLVARDSPVLWFFGVVTRPLTRPVAALLPVGTPEARVRLVSLAVYVTLWIGVRIVLAAIGVGLG